MTLATVDDHATPSARIVLLKGLDVDAAPAGASGRGFVWFTNYDSRKGHELDGDRRAALCFFWPELERQVRVEGRVAKTTADESDRYFASRPLESKIGAWVSPQSRVIASRAALEEAEAAWSARLAYRRVDRPAAALGRLPARADGDRVLAGAPVATARPARLSRRRRRLVDRAARAVIGR